MIDETIHQSHGGFDQRAKRLFVSLAINTGTIERHDFMNAMISAPAVTLAFDDSGHLLARIIQELKIKRVQVYSVVCNYASAQVSSVAHGNQNLASEGVLRPWFQSMKFVEHDRITICHVYLVLKTLQGHVRHQEDRKECSWR
jgi:hypothetical protein